MLRLMGETLQDLVSVAVKGLELRVLEGMAGRLLKLKQESFVRCPECI